MSNKDPAEQDRYDQRALYVFYEHARLFLHRHLGFPINDDLNYGQAAQQYIQMFTAPAEFPATAEWKRIINSTNAMADINVLVDVYTKVPEYVWNTDLAKKQFAYDGKFEPYFSNPGYTERSEHQLGVTYDTAAEQIEASSAALRSQLPEGERTVDSYIPKPYEHDGSIRWNNVDETLQLHVPVVPKPGAPVWAFGEADASIFVSTPKSSNKEHGEKVTTNVPGESFTPST
jgi:hypothetical protein